MSYDIFYDKQFVKVEEDKYIPMVLAGSSNCYDWSPSGKERRSRSWFNFSYLLDGNLIGTKQQMLDRQEQTRKEYIERHGEEYNDKSFGYFSALSLNGGGCNMTYGQYQGIVKTGCKKALTVEQLAEENIYLNFHTYSSSDTREKLKEQKLEPVNFTPKSTEQLLDFIDNVAVHYKGKEGGTIYITFSGMYESSPKWLRRKYFPVQKKEKKRVTTKQGFTISISNSKDNATFGYLRSYRGGAFRYGHSKDGGKQFLDKKQAEKWADKIDKRRPDFNFKVIKVEYNYEKTFTV